jgi:hypothetical protein
LRRSYPISYPKPLNQYTVSERMKTITAAILVVMLLASCSRPGPTTRSFQRADIIGEWTHRDSSPATQSTTQQYSVSVNLRDDGGFDQIIKIDGDPNVRKASGTWILTGSSMSLKGLLTHDWNWESDTATWTKQDADWWLVDWHGIDQRVALFGALHSDPDAFAPWTKNR